MHICQKLNANFKLDTVLYPQKKAHISKLLPPANICHRQLTFANNNLPIAAKGFSLSVMMLLVANTSHIWLMYA